MQSSKVNATFEVDLSDQKAVSVLITALQGVLPTLTAPNSGSLLEDKPAQKSRPKADPKPIPNVELTEAQPASDHQSITLDMVREKVQSVVVGEVATRAAVKELLAEYGATAVSKLKPEQLQDFYARLLELKS